MSKKIQVFLFITFASMSISYAQSYQDIIQQLQEMVGKPAPRFEGKTLAGKSYNSASLKGKIVVLNFWFVGCRHAKKRCHSSIN